ncbi:efflux RND transporter periplasmic adaptor subunit [Luteimonas kalidii]|uniref:Efflux RND transporter periplasmic adaptor subunit n=1 Tax=Luteimonas kalidii TaxID=3042025 RepID=A0ABT6JTS5_9GAMM|nr:efflux RND transporter periplasmic adaptor subunit [Luteimonas kalidii]MDH5834098.1 efflux RND transporter periplasmic adaptor subunit [Luteimonas kalidii]
MRPLTTSLFAAALVGTTALALLARGTGATEATPAAEPAPPAVVQVAPAVRTEFAPRHWAPGSVVSRRDSRVAGEVSGRVLRIAEVGDTVRAGAPLAVLDDTAVRLAEAGHLAAIGRAQSLLQLAQAQERRYAALSAQQAIARAQYEQQRAERDVLTQDLAGARAALAVTRHQRERMVVRAPFDGVVAERLVQPGEHLAAGAAVARLVDPAAREVRVHAPVALARHLAPGVPVLVRSEGDLRDAVVTALVPVGDDSSRQLELRVAVEEQAFAVGTAVTVGLPSARARAVVAVPRDAVVLRREGDFVVRVDAAGKAERLPVRTGEELDRLVEVEGAIAPGDRLVVRGAERLEPGQALRIEAGAEALAVR